jgi:hypothetical protein
MQCIFTCNTGSIHTKQIKSIVKDFKPFNTYNVTLQKCRFRVNRELTKNIHDVTVRAQLFIFLEALSQA